MYSSLCPTWKISQKGGYSQGQRIYLVLYSRKELSVTYQPEEDGYKVASLFFRGGIMQCWLPQSRFN